MENTNPLGIKKGQQNDLRNITPKNRILLKLAENERLPKADIEKISQQQRASYAIQAGIQPDKVGLGRTRKRKNKNKKTIRNRKQKK